MPKIVRNNARGLFQKAGKGSAGIESVEMSALTTSSTAAGNADVTVTCPAGAVITDVGFVAVTLFDVGTNNISFSCGVGSGGNDIVAVTQINQANADIAAGTAISVKSANLVHGSGGAIAFKNAAPLHSASERTIGFRITNSGTQTSAGTFRAYIKYVILSE